MERETQPAEPTTLVVLLQFAPPAPPPPADGKEDSDPTPQAPAEPPAAAVQPQPGGAGTTPGGARVGEAVVQGRKWAGEVGKFVNHNKTAMASGAAAAFLQSVVKNASFNPGWWLGGVVVDSARGALLGLFSSTIAALKQQQRHQQHQHGRRRAPAPELPPPPPPPPPSPPPPPAAPSQSAPAPLPASGVSEQVGLLVLHAVQACEANEGSVVHVAKRQVPLSPLATHPQAEGAVWQGFHCVVVCDFPSADHMRAMLEHPVFAGVAGHPALVDCGLLVCNRVWPLPPPGPAPPPPPPSFVRRVVRWARGNRPATPPPPAPPSLALALQPPQPAPQSARGRVGGAFEARAGRAVPLRTSPLVGQGTHPLQRLLAQLMAHALQPSTSGGGFVVTLLLATSSMSPTPGALSHPSLDPRGLLAALEAVDARVLLVAAVARAFSNVHERRRAGAGPADDSDGPGVVLPDVVILVGFPSAFACVRALASEQLEEWTKLTIVAVSPHNHLGVVTPLHSKL